MMTSLEAIADEYKIAYQQLKALDKQHRELQERLDRDFALAQMRYERARAAYLTLALDEVDEFLVATEDE